MTQKLSLKNITVDCAVSILQTYTRIALIIMSGMFLAGYAAAGDPIKINIASDTGKGSWSGAGNFSYNLVCCGVTAGRPAFLISPRAKKDSSLTGDVTVSITGSISSSNQNYFCYYDGLPVSIFVSNINIGGCVAPPKGALDAYNFLSNAKIMIQADLTNESTTEKTLTINDLNVWFMGAYGFALNGTITVPAASRCTLSAPEALSLPDISMRDLANRIPGSSIGAAVPLTINIDCTPVPNSTLTLKPASSADTCMGTNLTGYAICIDGLDFLSGEATMSSVTNGDKVLYIRNGRGRGRATPGKGTGVLTVTVSPL